MSAALVCEHIIGTAVRYDPALDTSVTEHVYCGKLAVRVWETAGGQRIPVRLAHAKAHPLAPLCYAGETEP